MTTDNSESFNSHSGSFSQENRRGSATFQSSPKVPLETSPLEAVGWEDMHSVSVNVLDTPENNVSMNGVGLNSLNSRIPISKPHDATSHASQFENDAQLVSVKTAKLLGRYQFLNDLRTSAPLLLIDCLAVVVAIFSARLANNLLGIASAQPSCFDSNFFGIGVSAFALAIQHIHGLYPAVGLGHSIEFRRILRTCLIVSLAVGVTLLASPQLVLPTFLAYLVFVGTLGLVLPLSRSMTRAVLSHASWWTQSILVVGDGAKAETVFNHLLRTQHDGLRPIGIAYDPSQHWSGSTTGARVYLGPASALEQILLSTKTTRVIITKEDAISDFHFGRYCNIPHVSLQTSWSNHPTEKANFMDRNGAAEIHCYQRVINPSSLLAKRCMDVAIISLFAPVLIPVFAVIAALIKLSSPGPIFYGQKRLGKNGRTFKVWKFRSMVPNADTVLQNYLLAHPELQDEWDRDHKLKKDPRITTIGRLLRKTSLDELPQLWNVFVGEMSLVGPRPIVTAEIPKYGEVYELYKLVSPGITGLWQISGRNNTTYEERLRYDRFYIQNWSVMTDLYILYRTAKTAVMQEGAY